MSKITKTLIIITGILVTLSTSLLAQNERIDVTNEHAELGRAFTNKVWVALGSGNISQPIEEYFEAGNGESIQINFEDPITSSSFKSTVDKVLNDNDEIISTSGGWVDRIEDVYNFFWLNSDVNDSNLMAKTMVLYNEFTGVAVFITYSKKL